MIIYKTTNLINGKFYIGKDVKNKKTYYGSGLILRKAILKYGKENFIKEILDECDSHDELCQKEIYWINKLDARNPDIGYNLAEGGLGGCLGCKVSDETKEKLSKIFKERKILWGAKISKSMKDKPKSDDHKNNIRKTMDEKYNNGYKSPNLGYKRSKEFIENASNRLKNGSGRNKKSVIIYGVTYNTIKEASEVLEISIYLINKLFRGK